MTERPEPIAPWTIRDLCIASGLSRKTVVKHMQAGQLPGQKLPDGKWIIPALWALAWMEGRWTPTVKDAEIEPVKPVTMIHRRSA